MPTLEGVNPGDFEVDDSNIERDSHVALHHRLEPHEPILPCPYPFVALSPSKDQPRSGFPKHNVGSWLQLVALYMGLGAFWPPWPMFTYCVIAYAPCSHNDQGPLCA
jgi:hypothetical protein